MYPTSPTDLHFRNLKTNRYFDLLPLALTDIDQAFTGTTFDGSNLTAPFQTIIADIASWASGNTLSLRIEKDDNNWFGCNVVNGGVTSVITLVAVNAGVTTTIWTSGTLTLTAPFRVALCQMNQSLAVLTHAGTGDDHVQGTWTILNSVSVSGSIDLRQQTVISLYHPAVRASASDILANVKCGGFGHVGIANPQAITTPAGVPYTVGNLLYFTGTAAGLQCTGGDQNAWSTGVFTINLTTIKNATPAVVLVSKILAQRDTEHTGCILGDGTGKIIVDTTTTPATYTMLFATFGNWNYPSASSVIVNKLVTQSTVLATGTHVLTGWALLAPTGVSNSYYDADAVLVGGTWYYGHSTTNLSVSWTGFKAELYSGPSLDSLTLVGNESTYNSTEGCRFFTVNGTTYFAFAVGNVYTVKTLAYGAVGTLDTNPVPGSAGVTSHPTIIPLPSGYGTDYLLLTMDGNSLLANPTGGSFAWSDGTTQVETNRSAWNNENWDSSTPPAGPIDWRYDASLVTSATNPNSSPNDLLYPAGSGNAVNLAMWKLSDTSSPDVMVSDACRWDAAGASEQDTWLMARATSSSAAYSALTSYVASTQRNAGAGSGLVLNRRVSGSNTQLAIVGDNTTFADSIYYRRRMIVRDVGGNPTINVVVQRLSDSKFLNSSAVWQTGVATAISFTDSNAAKLTGAGYVGIGFFTVAASVNVRTDDFSFQPAIATVAVVTGASVALSRTGTGIFNGTDTETLTCTAGTITVSDAGGTTTGNGTNSVTRTPVAGTTTINFTCSATCTVTVVDGQGWIELSPFLVTVGGGGGNAIGLGGGLSLGSHILIGGSVQL